MKDIWIARPYDSKLLYFENPKLIQQWPLVFFSLKHVVFKIFFDENSIAKIKKTPPKWKKIFFSVNKKNVLIKYWSQYFKEVVF